MFKFDYKPPGEISRAFMLSEKYFRGICGPVGSGKSSVCCAEIMRRASNQQKSPTDGKRRTRWAVIRNTNPQLKTTTIKTWLEWFPESVFGKFGWSVPYCHNIRINDIECEVYFVSMDAPEDVRKVLSMDLTGAWINEAREEDKNIIDALTMRVGRYPQKKMHGGPTWSGIIADTNPPDEDHWWPIMAGHVDPPEYMTAADKKMLVKPSNWEFFTQPAAMIETPNPDGSYEYKINPDAENIANLSDDYYSNTIAGKTKRWIDVYIMNRYGAAEESSPIYPMYNAELHAVDAGYSPVTTDVVYIGIDFGLTPAAIFGQKPEDKYWHLFRELVCRNTTIDVFGRTLSRIMRSEFPVGTIFKVYGDPTGDVRDPNKGFTPFQILKTHGINCVPAPSNDPVLRIETVSRLLNSMEDGKPVIVVHKRNVPMLDKGFDGGYKYKRTMIAGTSIFEDVPNKKNPYSHPHDALQYLLLGAGEGKILIGTDDMNGPHQQRKGNESIWTRRIKRRGRAFSGFG